MSARERLKTAVVAHLSAAEALRPLAVFGVPPDRAAMPYAVVDEPFLATWDAAAVQGFEGRFFINCHDDGERVDRVRRVSGRVDEAMLSLPRDLGGEGWRIATLRMVRSRIVPAKDRRWLTTSEYLVRVYRTM